MNRLVLDQLLLVSALAPALACVGIDPDWDGPVDQGTTVIAGESGDPSGESDEQGTGEATSDDESESADETGGGEELLCQAGASPLGACPEVCDQCIDGECRIACQGNDCRDAEIECPFGWPCRILCADKHACRDSTLTCTGEWGCAVECLDHRACDEALVLCAGGPCRVLCSHPDKPCEDLELVCGSRDSQITCEDAEHGHGPQAIPQPNSGCACTNDCET